jgi:hypothetical protein
MPTCKKCGEHFPLRVLIEGRKRNFCKRKYCLVCSPFGKHNTRELDRSLTFVCKQCGRDIPYNRSKGNKGTKCASCYVNSRRFSLKQKSVEYKGGCCQRCGYKRYVAALTFHHINPQEKDFTIAGNHCLSWERIRQELDKCILLCLNCHAEAHEEMRKSLLIPQITITLGVGNSGGQSA